MSLNSSEIIYGNYRNDDDDDDDDENYDDE